MSVTVSAAQQRGRGQGRAGEEPEADGARDGSGEVKLLSRLVAPFLPVRTLAWST